MGDRKDQTHARNDESLNDYQAGEDPGDTDPHTRGDRDRPVREDDTNDPTTESLNEGRAIDLKTAIEKSDCERNAIAIQLHTGVGLNPEEISELTVHDVDLGSREIRVGDRPCRVESMSPELAQDVRTWLENHRPGYAASGNDKYLIPDVTGRRLSVGQICGIVREAGAVVPEAQVAESETGPKERAGSVDSCDRGRDKVNPDGETKRKVPLNREELQRLFDVASSSRERLILRLAFEVGLRSNEITFLDRKDFDPETGTLHIRAKGRDQKVSLPKDLASDLEGWDGR